MRKTLTIAVSAAGALALLGGVAASSASASTTAVPTVKTLSPLHSDTTSVSGTATQTDPLRGPVWAADNLHEALYVTQIASKPGHYNVKIAFGGSTFAGFADPRSSGEGSTDPGGPLLSQGSITGSIQYNNIASATAPDPGHVPAKQAPGTGLQAVLDELFHSAEGSAASVHYLMNYTPSMNSVNVTGSGNTWNAGDTYTQAG
jgi:hypothetical protein